MADDARISTAFPRHPKTVKLGRRLGAPGCYALVCLFLWVAENRPEGDLKGMTTEDIEIAAGWPGDGGEFVRTLAYVRFLDGEENGYRLHDWAEHNPYVADRPRRIEKARAAAAARWNPKKVDPQRMLAACSEHESAMPSSPLLHAPPDAARRTSPPFTETGFDLSLQKEKYSQSDFDERDLRKYTDERKKIDLKLGSGWGADLTDDQIFEHACFMAGFTAKHMREVFARLYPENSA